jgi:hypothetical protein
MNIILKENHLAVLQTESGEVVALFGSTKEARIHLEKAVGEHFDCACSLSTPRDFEQPLDYEQPYTFMLYGEDEDSDIYETLVMTYAPLYANQ